MTRIVIIGGPKVGKTTTADRDYDPALVKHTDDTVKMGWSEASTHVATWLDEPGPWVIEGVAAVRALRKWLASHSTGKPCDEVRVLTKPRVPRSPGQMAMAASHSTIWSEVRGELRRRGVTIRVEGGR